VSLTIVFHLSQQRVDFLDDADGARYFVGKRIEVSPLEFVALHIAPRFFGSFPLEGKIFQSLGEVAGAVACAHG